MQVLNGTKIPARIINYFLRDLGISKATGKLVIVYGECSGRGSCLQSGNTYIITLSGEYTLETLSHELKHVEQHVSGLSEYMRLERESTPYKDRWHEVEARAYASKYA